MDFSDKRWVGLKGGYGRPYDPRGALRRLEAETAVAEAWSELWNELHHQGDVGEASYAAVIEEARSNKRNPPLPAWLADDYATAWVKLFDSGLASLRGATDETLVNAIMAVLALHKRQPMLARMAILSEEERRAMLDEVGWA